MTARPSWTGLLSTLALAYACPRAPEAEVQVAPLAIEVEYAGCAEVHAGPVCHLASDSMLTVWARGGPRTQLEVLVDGVVSTATPTAVDDGARWRIRVPAGSPSVVVRGTEDGAVARVSIPLAAAAIAPELAEADRLRFAGQFDEADALLASMTVPEDVRARARILAKRARLAMALGRTDDAIALFEEAIALDARSGLLSNEIADRAALGYALIYQTVRFADAETVLRPLEKLAREVPQGRSTASYFLGLLDQEAGSLRTAAAHLAAAREQATRLALDHERRAALDMEIDVLLTLGQRERARKLIDLLEQAAPLVTRPCDRSQLLHNLGVYRLLDGQAPDAALPHLRQAVALNHEACRNPRLLAHHTASLARGLARAGDPRAGIELLARLPPQPAAIPQVLLANAELSLATNDAAQAITSYARFAAATSESHHSRWRAALGTARAKLLLGQTGEAIDWLRTAEDTLESYAFLVPYGAGRSSFLDTYSTSSQLLVATLLDAGRIEEAWDAARRARRRGLAAITWRIRVETLTPEARVRWYAALEDHRRRRAALETDADEDWKLSSERLTRAQNARRARALKIHAEFEAAMAAVAPRPSHGDDNSAPIAPGELVILVHEGETQTVVFGALDGGLVAERIGTLTTTASPSALGARLLGPLEPQLARAERVRVWSSGVLDRIDVHALEVGGQRLIDRVPVVFGLDIGRPAASTPEPPGGDVIVVADPRGDLVEARAEANIVSGRARQLGRAVYLLTGDQGSRDAVLRRLEHRSSSLLHVATHGVYEGTDGWDSNIRLAHNDVLTISDILALDWVPPRVVMSGCDTGREGASRSTSLGLAHAFVLAGASAVVAAARSVDDADATAMMADLYASGDLFDLPLALARAQRSVARTSPGIDWASFRVIVP